MNRIVRENYPAAKLPEELREGIDPQATVTVTVVEGRALPDPELVQVQPHRSILEEMGIDPEKVKPVSIGDIRKLALPSGVTAEEAVARIRALRDEWED